MDSRMYFLSGDEMCEKAILLSLVTSVNVTFSKARVGTIARYAAMVAETHEIRHLPLILQT